MDSVTFPENLGFKYSSYSHQLLGESVWIKDQMKIILWETKSRINYSRVNEWIYDDGKVTFKEYDETIFKNRVISHIRKNKILNII